MNDISMLATSLSDMEMETVAKSNVKHNGTFEICNPLIDKDDVTTDGGKVIYDCVWFGSYPQAEIVSRESYKGINGHKWGKGDCVEDEQLYSTLKNAVGWDNNGDIIINRAKYRRIIKADSTYHYFRYEPIKWRVLSVNGNKALLLADKGMDNQKYNTTYTSVTWKTCTLRSWLNGYNSNCNSCRTDYSNSNFINSAFSGSEKAAIYTTTVSNGDNLRYETNVITDTRDKVFLLSELDVYSTESANVYGFATLYTTYDKARSSESSTYTKIKGALCSEKSDYYKGCDWWLRSPGYISYGATLVDSYGYVPRGGSSVDNGYIAVRPALHLNLSCTSVWSYAGTVSSDGTVDEDAATNGGMSGQDNTSATKNAYSQGYEDNYIPNKGKHRGQRFLGLWKSNK